LHRAFFEIHISWVRTFSCQKRYAVDRRSVPGGKMKKLLLSIVAIVFALNMNVSATPISVLYTLSGDGTNEFDSNYLTMHFYVTNNLVGYPLQNLYEFSVNGISAASPNVASSPSNFNLVSQIPNANFNAVWIDPNPGDNLQLPGTTIEFDVTQFKVPGVPNAVPSSLEFTIYTTDNGSSSSDYPVFPGDYVSGPSFSVVAGIQGDTFGIPEPSPLLLLGCGLAGVAIGRTVFKLLLCLRAARQATGV
jgi:hypothetical protein